MRSSPLLSTCTKNCPASLSYKENVWLSPSRREVISVERAGDKLCVLFSVSVLVLVVLTAILLFFVVAICDPLSHRALRFSCHAWGFRAARLRLCKSRINLRRPSAVRANNLADLRALNNAIFCRLTGRLFAQVRVHSQAFSSISSTFREHALRCLR